MLLGSLAGLNGGGRDDGGMAASRRFTAPLTCFWLGSSMHTTASTRSAASLSSAKAALASAEPSPDAASTTAGPPPLAPLAPLGNDAELGDIRADVGVAGALDGLCGVEGGSTEGGRTSGSSLLTAFASTAVTR